MPGTRGTEGGSAQERAFQEGGGACWLPGRYWIYPKSVSVRDYQFTMAKAAIAANALVCLPTGLGKTLIAAVVMANFYR